MGLMALNLATLNVRGIRDTRKRLLGELSNLSLNAIAVQESPFPYAADCQVLENNYDVLSAYDNRSSVGSLC